MSGIVSNIYGGGGGVAFNYQLVSSIGFMGGEVLNLIHLNGSSFGGLGGGSEGGIILLDSDEYINKVDICHGESRSRDIVLRASFDTNKGRHVGAGTTAGSCTSLQNIRLLGIEGRSGDDVDQLELTYIDDYTSSSVIESNANFIVSFSPPFETISQYSSSTETLLFAYQKVTEVMSSQTINASVTGELVVKLSSSLNITLKESSITTIKQSLEQQLSHISSTQQTIPDGHVGINTVSGQLLSNQGGLFWFAPQTQQSISVIPLDQIAGLHGYYDLTANLSVQMPGLLPFKIIKNGFVYYS